MRNKSALKELIVKHIVFLVLTVTSVLNCPAQINDFRDLLIERIANKTLVKRDTDIESERAFLGIVKDGKGIIIYYIAKEFYTVQAAKVKHGHSRILFFDKHKKMIASYNLDLREDLPYKLANNFLYFKYKVNSAKNPLIQMVKIEEKLPFRICVRPGDCYRPDMN